MEINNNPTLYHDSEFGVAIEAGLDPQQPQKILLRGKFRVPYAKDGVPDQGSRTLKHVVLVVTRSGNYQSLTPFQEVVVFADDVRDEGEVCSAFFNINVMDHIRFDGEGDYYILCSLGTYVSNIVKVTVS